MIGSLQREEIKNKKEAIFEIYGWEFSKINEGCQTTDLWSLENKQKTWLKNKNK